MHERPNPVTASLQCLGNRALLRILGSPLRRSCGCGGTSSCACEAEGKQDDVGKIVRQGLSSASRPLDAPLLRQMERSFGRRFDRVRVHTDAAAAASAREVDAIAYTVGSHIVFGAGAFRPQTDDGRRVLAHELTHVAQQEESSDIPAHLGRTDDPAEREAESAAETVRSGAAPVSRLGSSGFLRRASASKVSCAKNPAIVPEADPVAAITAAEKVGQQWMDDAIAALEQGIAAAQRGAPPSPNDPVASALRYVGIDPKAPAIWTAKGIGSVPLLVKRLKRVRKFVGTDSVFYTCRAPEGCQTGWYAFTNEGIFHVHLCKGFWNGDVVERAQTIVHETFHIVFDFENDTGREGNAHCYERLVQVLAGAPVAQFTDVCEEPK